MAASDRILFEIYREAGYNRRVRVVYFTELNEHNKESEINRALAGEHIYDGFIRDSRKDEAKRTIDAVLSRMNEGEVVDAEALERELSPFAPE
jgi:hypothetical protein